MGEKREKNRKEKADSKINQRAGVEDKKTPENVKSEEKIDFKYNMKVYLSILLKYRWLIFFLVIAIIIVELTLVFERLILKEVVDRGALFWDGTLGKDVFTSFIVLMLLLFLGLIVLRGAFSWTRMHLINKLESKAILDMKKRFFNHILGLSHGFHTSNKTGSLISRLVRGSSAYERMTDTIFFDFTPLFVQIFAVVIALSVFDLVSAITVFVVVVAFMSYSIYANRMIRKSNIIANDMEDDEKAMISDVFINIDSIKYFGKENTIKGKYYEKSNKTRAAYLKNWNYFRMLGAMQILIVGLGLAALLFVPFMRFLNHEITLGEIVFIYTIYGNIVNPMYRFVGGIRSYYRAMADFDALFKYELSHNEIIDAPDAKDLSVKKGAIEFRNINFSYKERKIVSGINLKIKAGQKVALVGSSGAGKSTIVKLLYRLYNLNEGEILIDGKNINEFKQESLRSELSIVPQDCALFDDTIYNNIAFSRPEASREEVLRAIKLAQLDKIIDKLSQKEETIVGERGVKLSGGERQRVSIARAILADKKILVLDEATSSLDSETEHEIQKALHELMKGRTSIIIAHRLSTVMSADTIVVLEEGRIVQTGTHAELIKKKGIYKKLWTLQKGGYLQQG
ncbi:MAG: ABC transporter ATP-binding protein [Candidatus Nanoarchaeia archaeon]